MLNMVAISTKNGKVCHRLDVSRRTHVAERGRGGSASNQPQSARILKKRKLTEFTPNAKQNFYTSGEIKTDKIIGMNTDTTHIYLCNKLEILLD
jgi:hypothetical protein